MKYTAIIIAISFLSFSAFTQNFGIGTASPGAKLEISGVGGQHDGVLTEHIRLSSDASHYSSIKTAFSNTAADNRITFSVDQDHSLSPIDVMTLRGDGSVGIGTTNPTEMLEVDGNIKAPNITPASTTNNFSDITIYSDAIASGSAIIFE